MASPDVLRAIGLMSGTSLDGIDAALVEFRETSARTPEWRVVAAVSTPYEEAQRKAIHDAIVHGDAAALCRIHAELGEWLADAALHACRVANVKPEDVDVIGSHGQTIWHEPPTATRRGATLQLGCPSTIAERTGIDVVSDFRTRDVAAGGEGAPLVPWVDRLLFTHPERRRALQNIGGMGNVTWLGAAGSAEPLLAFDTGPGVAMIDAAVRLATNGAESFDRDGARAARGAVIAPLFDEALGHPYYAQTPPKSTGRETFGMPMVEELAQRYVTGDAARWPDFIATLTAVTARTIGDAYRRWIIPRGVDEVFVSGGGARNPSLMALLRRELEPVPVHDGSELGVDADFKEALAFAALAWAHRRGIAGNVPEATGARGPRVLGSFTPANRAGFEVHSR
jgi:anhydro-N-acetylmuramic acid kinase